MAESERLIHRDKSVIVAADVNTDKLPELVQRTCLVEGIGGYKIGIELSLENGLPRVVDSIREHTQLPIIYDHQKAGNDIPDMGAKFANVCKRGGVDAVILFPFSSPRTQREWTKACQEAGLIVLIGGHMTHDEFLHSEGGYISDDAPERIYALGAEMKVRDFVVPGNKVQYVEHYRMLLEGILGEGGFTLYSPGFITQGGEISEYAQVAGSRWNTIVGEAIYKAVDITQAAKQVTKQIK